MSLLLHGPSEDIQKLSKLIRSYQRLLESKSFEEEISESDQNKLLWTVENKYYTASITLNLLDFTQSDDFNEEFEGIILIPHPSKSDLGDSFYSLGHDAADRDLGLRLLVSFITSDVSAGIANNENLLWAVDHGFEYIEINESTLLESHNERDKLGLPRLIEALQSMMWSTAKKKLIPKPQSFTETKPIVPETQHEITNKDSNHNDESMMKREVPIEEEGDEEDMKFFELFAASLNQARTIREQAISGQLSDKERRSQAEAMAKKFSELLKLGEDSDEEIED